MVGMKVPDLHASSSSLPRNYVAYGCRNQTPNQPPTLRGKTVVLTGFDTVYSGSYGACFPAKVRMP